MGTFPQFDKATPRASDERADETVQEKIANKLNLGQSMKDRKYKETVDKLFY